MICFHFIVAGLFSPSYHNIVLIYRYIELLYPLWHKAHFKMNYIYISLATCWILGIGSNVAYKIPTSAVTDMIIDIKLLLDNVTIADIN